MFTDNKAASAGTERGSKSSLAYDFSTFDLTPPEVFTPPEPAEVKARVGMLKSNGWTQRAIVHAVRESGIRLDPGDFSRAMRGKRGQKLSRPQWQALQALSDAPAGADTSSTETAPAAVTGAPASGHQTDDQRDGGKLISARISSPAPEVSTALESSPADQEPAEVQASVTVTDAERRAEAERFLAVLDAEAESFVFQTFDDDKERKAKLGQDEEDPFAHTISGSLDACWSELEKWNQQNAGVYVTVSESRNGRRKTGDINRVRAVFADFDKPDSAPALADYPLAPVMLVNSSPGKTHAYWLVDDLPLLHFKPMQKAVAARLGSDSSVCDLPRVMRLPGFFHCKDPDHRHLVRIAYADERLPYKAEDVHAAFGQQANQQQHTHQQQATDQAAPTAETAGAAWTLKAKRIALDAAIRTVNDPSLSRHREIYSLGCRAKRDRLPPDALDIALQVFAENMRPTDTTGEATGINWPNERAAINDGYRDEVVGGNTAQVDFSGINPQPQQILIQPELHAPEPLRAPLAACDEYPVNALGAILGKAVSALHEGVKAPLALCAQSVLAAASFAAQAHFDAQMPWGEIKPLSLAMLTVGESGERKSGVDDLVLGAAKVQERAEIAQYEQARDDYEAELQHWKAALDQGKKRASSKGQGKVEDYRREADKVGPKPAAPMLPLRFVTDPTVEGLYKLLAIGQPSVALFSDEGGLLIGGHALNSENALKTLARWCKLWDGSPFDRVRAGDGSGILYGRRMALHQLAQPDIMSKLLSDPTANGQGFLARCLVAWPTSTIGTRHIQCYEKTGERAELRWLFGRLKGLFETRPRTKDECGQVLDPIPLPLSAQSNAMAVEASNRFESLMAPGEPLCEFRDRASKAMDNAIRIAGILTVVEQGLSAREIGTDQFTRALVLIQWYLAEALRIRGAAVVPQSVTDAETLLSWLKERGTRLFRSALVLTSGPAQLRNKPRFSAAINELVSNGYLIPAPPGTEVDGVKARLAWRVHPDVL